MLYLFVGLGGILGAISRYAISKAIHERTDSSFPFGTLVVNITGAFFLSFILGLGISHQGLIGKNLELALTTGFLGAYTTFSTFSYETFQSIQEGELYRPLAYVLLTIFLGLMGAWLGFLSSTNWLQ